MPASDEEYISFDSFANTYDFSRAISDDLLNIFLENFLEMHTKYGKLTNILEIGCGTGRISKIFGINNFNITGVDISSEMLELAMNKSKEQNWKFTGILSDARNLPFENNQFDISYTVHVLHLIKNWKTVIDEALRCSNNRFADIVLNRSIFQTDIMKNYWLYLREINNSSKLFNEKKIGSQNSTEVKEYMETKGFLVIKNEFKHISKVKKETLIKIVKLKPFSSQRFIPDDVHSKIITYLEENNFFLREDQEDVNIEETGIIFSYSMI